MWTPGPTWSVLHPGGPPLLVPLSSCTGGYGPHPPETDQDSCPGWLPPVPLDLVSPQEGFSPGPLSPRFKRFPATRILPITLCVFSMWYWHKHLCGKNTANSKSLLILKILQLSIPRNSDGTSFHSWDHKQKRTSVHKTSYYTEPGSVQSHPWRSAVMHYTCRPSNNSCK